VCCTYDNKCRTVDELNSSEGTYPLYEHAGKHMADSNPSLVAHKNGILAKVKNMV